MKQDLAFPAEFEAWLVCALADDVPAAVVAFSFHLFEPSSNDAKFGVELIGAGEFDPTDSDWACEDVWEPFPRDLHIPLAFASSGWEACLRDVRQLVMNMLNSSTPTAAKLKASQAVAIGFVDGDLEVIWQKSPD